MLTALGSAVPAGAQPGRGEGGPPGLAVELVRFEALPGPREILVVWETASEIDNLGFRLYRRPAGVGSFAEITHEVVRGGGTTDFSATYAVLDRSVLDGEPVEYLLEDIEFDGDRALHGPIEAMARDGLPSFDAGAVPADRVVVIGSASSASRDPGPPRPHTGRGLTDERLVRAERGPAGAAAVTPEIDGGDASPPRAQPASAGAPQSAGSGEAADAERREVQPDPARASQPRVERDATAAPGRPHALRDAVAPARSPPAHPDSGPTPRAPGPSTAPLNPAAGLPGLKLATRGRGLVALPARALLAAGLDPAVPLQHLNLSRQGRPVAFELAGAKGSRLGAVTTLIFFAEGFEDRYGDLDVYFLAAGAGPAPRVGAVDAHPGPPTPEASSPVRHRRELRPRTLYLPRTRNGEGDNFAAAAIFDTPGVFRVPTPAAAPGRTRVRVRLQGGTSLPELPLDHHFRIEVPGADRVDVRFDGVDAHEVALELSRAPAESLAVEISPGRGSGAEYDLVYLDSIEVEYPRRLELQATDAGQLLFESPRDGRLEVTGLAHPDTARVWDVSDPGRPRVLRGAAPLAGGIAFRAERGRRYAVADGGAELAPVRIWRNRPTRHAQRGGADWLAIAHGSLLRPVRELARHRRRQGLATAVVDIADVYDEMAGGRATPHAIRRFVAAATAAWNPAPRYLLLVGDASYDYRGRLGGAPGLVPSMLVDTELLEAASDSWLADLDGDTVPELAVGRLPVRGPAELTRLVHKLIDFETDERRRAAADRVLLVADAAEGADAVAIQHAVSHIERAVPASYAIDRVLLGALPRPGRGLRAKFAILRAMQRPLEATVYVGHGGARIWSEEQVLTAPDLELHGLEVTRLVITVNCLNGFFDAPREESLGEAFLAAPRGGSVAFLGPSRVLPLASQVELARAFVARALHSREPRIGDAVRSALRAVAGQPGSADVARTFVLLGDPATPLGRAGSITAGRRAGGAAPAPGEPG